MKLLPLLCSLALLSPASLPAQEPQTAALGWDGDKQSRFPTSLAADHAGGVWVGTEGDGVWRHDGKKWTQFTTKEGLGDNYCYALAVDKVGRVWAGHLRSGVSVWNGEKWRNYGLLDGPIGDHVFAIAVSPHDGDVWIATDAGLARWRAEKDEWSYYTRAAGLPADQVQALAFDDFGSLYAGTQCHGIAIAECADDYRTWRHIPGPRFARNSSVGMGLPSAMINSLALVRDVPTGQSAMLAGTPGGLGLIQITGAQGERAEEVQFMRGADWEENVLGQFDPGNEGLEMSPGQLVMKEDWTTAITEAPPDAVWLGHRMRGAESLSTEGKTEPKQIGDVDEGWVRAFLLVQGQLPMAAIYGPKDGGLIVLPPVPGELPELFPLIRANPPFPSPANPPTANSLAALQKRVTNFKMEIKPGGGVFLGDDWRTQGDWVGRYGRVLAVLPGMKEDHNFVACNDCAVTIEVGPHVAEGQTRPVRYSSDKETDDSRVLFDPRLGKRSNRDVADRSVNPPIYPLAWEGPDLLLTVEVSDEMQRVSLYMVNTDDHLGRSYLRDHEIELWPAQTTYDEMSDSDNRPLARARVRDFYGGVYKQFAVRGPGAFIFRIRSNHSFVTKVQGVFIDPLPLTEPKNVAGIAYAPPPLPARPLIVKGGGMDLLLVRELWEKYDVAYGKTAAVPLQWPARLWAYRAAVAEKAPPDLLANWRWQLGIWTAEDRAAFAAAVTGGEAQFPPKPTTTTIRHLETPPDY